MYSKSVTEISYYTPGLSRQDRYKFNNMISYLQKSVAGTITSCRIFSVKTKGELFEVGKKMDANEKSDCISVILNSEKEIFLYSFSSNSLKVIPIADVIEITYFKESKCFCENQVHNSAAQS